MGGFHGTTAVQVWTWLLPLTGALFVGVALAVLIRTTRRDEDLEYRECGRTLGPDQLAGMPCLTVRNRWKAWRGWVRVVQPSGTEKDFPISWFGPVLDADALAEAIDVHEQAVHPD